MAYRKVFAGDDFSAKTIAGGAITTDEWGMFYTVDTQGGAASDDLDTINQGACPVVGCELIILRAANAAHTVVVKHNTGNIWLRGGADVSLDDLEDGIMLCWDDDNNIWFDLGGTGGGGGLQGDTGVPGDQGDTGIGGDQGDTGVGGSQGDSGVQGPQGDSGIGQQGDTGNQGDSGVGVQGDTGLSGDTGVGTQGDSGVAGDTGSEGPQGDSGVSGDTGVEGPQGDSGVSGDTGEEGPQGDSGVAGDTGAASTVAGDTGLPGDTGVGQQGDSGVSGDTGAEGPQGDSGVDGDQGDTGIQGDTGVVGVATDSIWDAAGDVAVGTGANTAARRAMLAIAAAGNLGATPTIDWTSSVQQTGTVNASITSLSMTSPVIDCITRIYLTKDDSATERTIVYAATTELDHATNWVNSTPLSTMGTTAKKRYLLWVQWQSGTPILAGYQDAGVAP